MSVLAAPKYGISEFDLIGLDISRRGLSFVAQFNYFSVNASFISLTEWNSCTTQNFSFVVNTAIKLKNVTATSDNEGT